MKSLNILESTRDLLLDENKWTQSAYARDENGNSLGWADLGACSWCLLGALYKTGILDCDADQPTHEAYGMLRRNMKVSINEFNDDDNTDHSVIIHFLDDVIAKYQS